MGHTISTSFTNTIHNCHNNNNIRKEWGTSSILTRHNPIMNCSTYYSASLSVDVTVELVHYHIWYNHRMTGIYYICSYISSIKGATVLKGDSSLIRKLTSNALRAATVKSFYIIIIITI